MDAAVEIVKLQKIIYTHIIVHFMGVVEMEEQKNQTEQEKNVIDEQKLNRQINYFIMRYMWQVICGRSATDTIYNVFCTSRERFTRVINTGVIRYGKGELKGLQQITGLSADIFTGKRRFMCPHKDKTGKIQDIITTEWIEYFKWRKDQAEEEDKEKKTEMKKEMKKREKDILDKLKNIERSNRDNLDFFRLCYFLKERQPAPIRFPSDEVQSAKNALNRLTFDILDHCDTKQLENLKKEITSKLQLVSGILFYKAAKEKLSKKGD